MLCLHSFVFFFFFGVYGVISMVRLYRVMIHSNSKCGFEQIHFTFSFTFL